VALALDPKEAKNPAGKSLRLIQIFFPKSSNNVRPRVRSRTLRSIGSSEQTSESVKRLYHYFFVIRIAKEGGAAATFVSIQLGMSV
jgi:hypothetical protein